MIPTSLAETRIIAKIYLESLLSRDPVNVGDFQNSRRLRSRLLLNAPTNHTSIDSRSHETFASLWERLTQKIRKCGGSWGGAGAKLPRMLDLVAAINMHPKHPPQTNLSNRINAHCDEHYKTSQFSQP